MQKQHNNNNIMNYEEVIQFLKKSSEFPGLEIYFTLNVSGSYREEVLPPICSNPDRSEYYDPGENEIFEIGNITVVDAVVWSYQEEENRELDTIIEEIELEIDRERRQGLIEKLCMKTDIGGWGNLKLTEKEEDELKQEILTRIYVY